MPFGYNQYIERLENKIIAYKTRYGQQYKKMAFKLAYWNLCFLFKKRQIHSSFSDSYQHILFDVRGGIGDIVVNAKYIKAFAEKFVENTQIDILSEENSYDINKIIFANIPINAILTNTKKNYDLIIHLVRFPIVKQFFSKRLSADLLAYVERLNQFHKENPLVTTNDFYGKCYAEEQGHTREDEADIDKLLNVKGEDWQLQYSPNSAEILERIGLTEQKYITLHTGYGNHFIGVESETRQWSEENYNRLTKMLKDAYPQYQIVQIGEVRQPKIESADIDLRGKTTFEDLLVILRNAKLHISQEGGIAILRHFLKGGTSVILFGPTDESFYGFDENINLTTRRCPHPCEWLHKDWMKKCMKSGDIAECMQLLTPEFVMEEIKSKGGL